MIVKGYGIEGVAIASVIAEYSILFFVIYAQFGEKLLSRFNDGKMLNERASAPAAAVH